MISKLKKFLVLALEKPAPICSMILDPRIKLKHLEKNQEFLDKQNISTLTAKGALQSFNFEAWAYDCSPSKMQQPTTSKKSNKKNDSLLSNIEADIFGEATIAQDLGAGN